MLKWGCGTLTLIQNHGHSLETKTTKTASFGFIMFSKELGAFCIEEYDLLFLKLNDLHTSIAERFNHRTLFCCSWLFYTIHYCFDTVHCYYSLSLTVSFCLARSVSLCLCLCLSVCLSVCLSLPPPPPLSLSLTHTQAIIYIIY